MAERATILIDVRGDEARQEIDQLRQDFDSLEIAGRDATNSLELGTDQVTSSLQSYRTQLDRTQQAQSQLQSSASGTATQLGFELTQAAQDAQFGMAGVANQIPLIAEQFQRLQTQSGSTTGALRSLLSTFAGPTGFIALGTLLPTVLPTILDFFDSTGEAAKDAKEDIQDALDTILEFQEIEGQRQIPREALPQAISQQRARLEALRVLLDRQEEIQATDVPLEQLGLAGATGQLQEAQELVRERFDTEEATTQQIQQTVTAQEQLLSRLEERQRKLEDIRRLRRDIEAIGGEPTGGGAGQIDLPGLPSRFQDPGVVTAGPDVRPGGSQLGRTPAERRQARLDRMIGEGTRQALARMPSQDVLRARTIRRQMEQAGEEIDRGVNQQLAQGIRLASQLGATLVQSAQEGSLTFQQAFSQILSVAGQVVGFFNPAAGAALAGGGQLIGSFQHGGRVDTPFQIVGERGPEIAAMPEGSRVTSNRDFGTMMGAVVDRLDRVERAIGEREVVLPVRETKNKMVEDDLQQGQKTGKTLVANVNAL